MIILRSANYILPPIPVLLGQLPTTTTLSSMLCSLFWHWYRLTGTWSKQKGPWEKPGLMQVLALYVTTRIPHMRTLWKNSMYIIELCGSNFPFLFLPFPSINTPPSWCAGQSVHMACRVCINWVATLSFSWINKSFLVRKHLVQNTNLENISTTI